MSGQVILLLITSSLFIFSIGISYLLIYLPSNYMTKDPVNKQTVLFILIISIIIRYLIGYLQVPIDQIYESVMNFILVLALTLSLLKLNAVKSSVVAITFVSGKFIINLITIQVYASYASYITKA